jgi:hypothetical protein
MNGFAPTKSSSQIEIQGCIYTFETPGSKLKIRFFQSAVGSEVSNGIDFLKFLKPVRELLASSNIKDIRQLVQRELDDVRIIKSLIPYLLNKENILGENGIAFFPSVLGVLMPKDYLNSLDKNYPKICNETSKRKDNYLIEEYHSSQFNWSVKKYFDSEGKPMAFASLTIDTNNCDVVVIDGQHRINAFRAACNSLTTDNDVIKQVYDSCSRYPDGVNANLPITIIWFEHQNLDKQVEISPEIISRRLFIDVNSSARAIATSRKILLDDQNPVNLLTNQFYSIVAESFGFNMKELSLAQLGFDVPNEVSQQGDYYSMPFTYITTPERLKYVFHAFFVRPKSYSIRIGKVSIDARKGKYSSSTKDSASKTELNIMFASSDNCIETYKDEYEDRTLLFVSDDLIGGETKQNIVRNEFSKQYFKCFYKLLSEFGYFKNYLRNLYSINEDILNNGDVYEKETWNSVFLEGKSLFYALKNKSQENNKFSIALRKLENDFKDLYLINKYTTYHNSSDRGIKYETKQINEENLLISFRTLAFQIGFVQGFYEFAKCIHTIDFDLVEAVTLEKICDEYLEKVNLITFEEWANYFEFLRDIHGEMNPNNFPVITHLILRKIQNKATIFDEKLETKYFAPECLYFHSKTVLAIDKVINDNFGEAKIKGLNLTSLLLEVDDSGITYQSIFDSICEDYKNTTQLIFKNHLNIETNYLEELYDKLKSEILKSLVVK